MNDFRTILPNQWRKLLDFLATFWPLMATPIVAILSIRLQHPWLGVAVFVGIALARRWWWTCIFGLMNGMAIFAGLIGCAIVGVRMWARSA
jgi:hypothetical protein